MAYKTVETIIDAAIRSALKVTTAIPDKYIRLGVDYYNASEPFVWRKWPWHNRKVAEIEIEADSDGIITFNGDNSSVDIIRAVRSVDADGDGSTLVWNQTDIRSAINGDTVGSGKFDKLSDDDDGNRRIQVNTEDEATTYKVLAFKRFVTAVIDADYDSENPDDTPYDYRVLTWQIDRAEAPLIAYIADQLRIWATQEPTGKWAHALNGTIKDLTDQEATEQLITPDYGSFDTDW